MTAEIGALETSAGLRRKPGFWDRWILGFFQNIRTGSIEVVFEKTGASQKIQVSPGPQAKILIHRSFDFLHMVTRRGDIGFAEAYIQGAWTTPDLRGLMYLLTMNLEALDRVQQRSMFNRVLTGLYHRTRKNTRRGSRRNIASHYDLGNDFYARWLDPSMTYSAAVYEGTTDLEEAQLIKYERLLDLIDPDPGDHLLEIGCGWGGFAEAAASWGVKVTGITISQKQHDFALARLQSRIRSKDIDIQLCDYRDLDGQFDHIVSIEMFEAVGEEYWEDFFQTIWQQLRPGGRAALQIITIREDMFDEYRANSGGFIQRYIFPGGMLPTKQHLWRISLKKGFDIEAMHSYGEHYADTLADWAEKFSEQEEWLSLNGYDPRFRAMWNYYLAFCEAGFRDGRLDVVQLALSKPRG